MGKKNKAHRFCPECSSSILIDFKNSDVERQRPLLAMNAAMFKGMDLNQTDVEMVEGRAKFDPPYEGY
jgi:hypothetical protein